MKLWIFYDVNLSERRKRFDNPSTPVRSCWSLLCLEDERQEVPKAAHIFRLAH